MKLIPVNFFTLAISNKNKKHFCSKNTRCTFWDSPSFWCLSPNLQVYTFMLDNYPALLEVNVKYCVLPKFLSLICIREGFIEKNRGTFQIGVDNPPPSNSEKQDQGSTALPLSNCLNNFQWTNWEKYTFFHSSMNKWTNWWTHKPKILNSLWSTFETGLRQAVHQF